MRWDLPGKVMIIDDRFSTIKEFVDRLTRSGIPVLFWNGKGKPPPSSTGVRIVLLDLDLTDSGQSYDYYDDAARILGLLPGPYAVLIYSVNATDDSAARIEQAYSNVHYGRQIPGFVIRPPVLKQKDPDVSEIVRQIKSFLMSKPVLDSILLAERNLESGKDSSLAELAQKKFDPSFRTLIKSIADDRGPESVTRELMTSLVRFQTRHVEKTRDYSRLERVLMGMLKTPITGGSVALHGRIMHLRMYYKPDKKERPWTGDVYRTRSNTESRRYAILITPFCDISTSKASHLRFSYGFTVTKRDLEENPNHVLYTLDQNVKRGKAALKYLGFKGIPTRFYPLDNFVQNGDPDDMIRVIFDFESVDSTRSDRFRQKKWQRVWRLDSPYIEDLLQKFGSHSFRIGTPARLEVSAPCSPTEEHHRTPHLPNV
jgi:hypothetical protein